MRIRERHTIASALGLVAALCGFTASLALGELGWKHSTAGLMAQLRENGQNVWVATRAGWSGDSRASVSNTAANESGAIVKAVWIAEGDETFFAGARIRATQYLHCLSSRGFGDCAGHACSARNER
jgi:hypothetical protein